MMMMVMISFCGGWLCKFGLSSTSICRNPGRLYANPNIMDECVTTIGRNKERTLNLLIDICFSASTLSLLSHSVSVNLCTHSCSIPLVHMLFYDLFNPQDCGSLATSRLPLYKRLLCTVTSFLWPFSRKSIPLTTCLGTALCMNIKNFSLIFSKGLQVIVF